MSFGFRAVILIYKHIMSSDILVHLVTLVATCKYESALFPHIKHSLHFMHMPENNFKMSENKV